MPNKVKIHEESAFVFTASGNYTNSLFPSGTTFIHWDSSQATSQGLVLSDICDLGQAPRTNLFEWRARVYFGNEKSADLDAEFYLSTADSIYSDGSFGSGIPAPTNFNPVNLQSLGTVRCPYPSGVGQASGRIHFANRCVNLLGFLPTASGSWNNSSYSYFMLTPVPLEVQDQ